MVVYEDSMSVFVLDGGCASAETLEEGEDVDGGRPSIGAWREGSVEGVLCREDADGGRTRLWAARPEEDDSWAGELPLGSEGVFFGYLYLIGKGWARLVNVRPLSLKKRGESAFQSSRDIDKSSPFMSPISWFLAGAASSMTSEDASKLLAGKWPEVSTAPRAREL
jgi:hypothetical protein